MVSQRRLTLQNASRVPVVFRWSVPKQWAHVVGVAPRGGLLQGNESASCTWSFFPRAVGDYSMRLQCSVYGLGTESVLSSYSTALRHLHAVRVRCFLLAVACVCGLTVAPLCSVVCVSLSPLYPLYCACRVHRRALFQSYTRCMLVDSARRVW